MNRKVGECKDAKFTFLFQSEVLVDLEAYTETSCNKRDLLRSGFFG